MSSNVLHDFYYGVLLLVSAFTIWHIRKTRQAFRLLSWLILITACSEVIAKVVPYVASVSNSAVYHIFTPVEYMVFTLIYFQLLTHKTWKRLLLISCIFLWCAALVNMMFFQPIASSNTNIMMLESVFLVFFALILFAEIKDYMLYENLLEEGVFWFNSVVIIYYAFNILVWGFHSFKIYMLDNPPVLIYRINIMFSALLYLVYAWAIWLSLRQAKLVKKST